MTGTVQKAKFTQAIAAQLWCYLKSACANLERKGVEGQQLLLLGQMCNDLHLRHVCMRQGLCHSSVNPLYQLHKCERACSHTHSLKTQVEFCDMLVAEAKCEVTCE